MHPRGEAQIQKRRGCEQGDTAGGWGSGREKWGGGGERGTRILGTSEPSQPLGVGWGEVYRMLQYWGGACLGRLRMWESKASSLGWQRKPKAQKQAAAGNP